MGILLTLPLLEERAFLKFGECLSQLLLRIHHDGTVPRDGLFERLSRDQKKSDSIVPGLYGDFVATIKKYERSIIRHGRSSRWAWLASLLILQEMWKTDHRVPEETQASAAGQDDVVARQSRIRSKMALSPHPDRFETWCKSRLRIRRCK